MVFFISPIFSIGMGAAMAPVYFEKNEPSQRAATVWSAFTILLISASGLLLLGLPFARFWSQVAFQTADYQSLVAITFWSTALSILSVPFLLHLQFEERAKLYATFTVINTIVSISSNILLVVVFHQGIRGVIIGNLITQVVNLTLFAFPAVSKLKFSFRRETARELLQLGIPLSLFHFFVYPATG